MHVDSSDISIQEKLYELSLAAYEQISSGSDSITKNDLVEISEEALTALKDSALRPLAHNGYTLRSLEERVNVVRAEIASIWNSSLPDKEKHLQISSKEWEIALLQAGQFEFAKSALSRMV